MKPLSKSIQTCLLALFVFLISFGSASAQYPSFTYSYGHNVSNDAQNNSGFIIHPYYGNYASGGNLDTGYLLVRNVDDGAGNIRIKLTATQRTGSVSVNNWSRTIGSGNERCTAVQWDSRDNTYVLTGYKKLPNGRYELLLMKVNASGTPLWEYSFGSNLVNCANCATNITNPNLFGTSIIQVKNDLTPANNNEFVIAGFVSRGDGVGDFTSVKRCLIWRVNITPGGTPVITTKFLKVFHGPFWQANKYEPTNFDVPVSVTEVAGKGFLIEGSTKDTGKYSNVLVPSGAPNAYTTTSSMNFKPFYGLIPYTGGTAYNGPGTFIYAYYDSTLNTDRVHVKMLPDINTNTGYLATNYYSRGWFDILTINLSTGIPINPINRYVYMTDTSQHYIATNIINLNSSAFTVTGYVYTEGVSGYYHPFTLNMSKTAPIISDMYVNKFRSRRYLGYKPVAGYDFFKTRNDYLDTFYSVITPTSGILDNHIVKDDIVLTGPYSAPLVVPTDTANNATISLFTNRTAVTCRPDSFSRTVVPFTYGIKNYRLISNVDPMGIYQTTHNPIIYNDVSILDCVALVSSRKGGIIQEEANDINVYPNPFESTISFTTSDWMSYIIRDVLSKAVNVGSNSGINEVNVSELPNGMYFLAVQLKNNQQKVFKIIKR